MTASLLVSAGPDSAPTDEAGPGTGVRVVVLRGWAPDQVAALHRRASADRPVLPVLLTDEVAVVGPVDLGGAPCLGCAETWRRQVLGSDHVPHHHLPWRSVAPVPAVRESALLVARRRAAELSAALETGEGLSAEDRSAAWVLRADDLAASSHHLLPHPDCLVCRPTPDDAPSPPAWSPEPLPTPAGRARSGRAVAPQQLRDVLVDHRFGPVAHVFRDEQSPLCLVTAELVVPGAHERRAGYGRDTTYPASEQVTLFEALERAAGCRPWGRRTSVRASRRALLARRDRVEVLDPRTLGLPDADGAEHALTAYDEDATTRWVWGTRLGDEQPVLVPEHVAYWGVRRREDAVWVAETSNGCAVGGSAEEATVHALMEVAERDAFLMAWCTGQVGDELVLGDEQPGEDRRSALGHGRARLDAAGFDLRLFDVSHDLGVPVVLSLAEQREPGESGTAFFAAGSGLDLTAAAGAAVAELATTVLLHPQRSERFPQMYDAARLRPMLEHPELVVELDDHVALNSLPEAAPRRAFLEGRPRRRLDAARTSEGRPAPTLPGHDSAGDLRTLLRVVLDRFAAAGLDPVVVDQSLPAVRERLGLHAVKAVVPGSLPMTFGHTSRRTRDLPRLLTVEHRPGCAPPPRHHDDVVVHPHPFP